MVKDCSKNDEIYERYDVNKFNKDKHKLMPIFFEENKDALKVTQFPAGEPNIEIDYNWLATRTDVSLHLIYPYHSFLIDTMFHIMDILKSLNIKFSLYLPYMPYARADRSISVNGNVRIEMITRFLDKIINNYNENLIKIYTYSIHCNLYNYGRYLVSLENIFNDLKVDDYEYIILSDKGMYNRFLNHYKDQVDKIKIAVFDKVRTNSGIEFELSGKYDTDCTSLCELKNKKCIIVDDIIDGGATIEFLANKLNECKQLDVYAVHGIFSGPKGMKLDGIDNVYCMFNYLNYK